MEQITCPFCNEWNDIDNQVCTNCGEQIKYDNLFWQDEDDDYYLAEEEWFFDSENPVMPFTDDELVNDEDYVTVQREAARTSSNAK